MWQWECETDWGPNDETDRQTGNTDWEQTERRLDRVELRGPLVVLPVLPWRCMSDLQVYLANNPGAPMAQTVTPRCTRLLPYTACGRARVIIIIFTGIGDTWRYLFYLYVSPRR